MEKPRDRKDEEQGNGKSDEVGGYWKDQLVQTYRWEERHQMEGSRVEKEEEQKRNSRWQEEGEVTSRVLEDGLLFAGVSIDSSRFIENGWSGKTPVSISRECPSRAHPSLLLRRFCHWGGVE